MICLTLFVASICQGQSKGLTFGQSLMDKGAKLALTDDGQILVLATIISDEQESEDLYIFKLDSTGNMLWSRQFGTERFDRAIDLKPTSDGHFLVLGMSYDKGFVNYDNYVVKLNSEGAIIWEKTPTSWARDTPKALHVTASDDFFVLGASGRPYYTEEVLLTAANSTGQKQWDRRFERPYPDVGFDMLENEEGYILLCTFSAYHSYTASATMEPHGYIQLIQVDFNGDSLWQKPIPTTQHEYGKKLLPSTIDDSYYILGHSQQNSNGSFDMLLLNVDKTGAEQWRKLYGGERYEYGVAIAMLDDNRLYLGGTTRSTGLNKDTDLYLVQTDEAGNENWSLTIGGEGDEHLTDMAVLPNGDCLLLGHTTSYGAGLSDIYLVKVSPEGKIHQFNNKPTQPTVHAKVFPNPAQEEAYLDIPTFATDAVYTLTVVDAAGRLIYTKQVEAGRTFFPVREWGQGMYFYHLHLNDNVWLYGKLAVY